MSTRKPLEKRELILAIAIGIVCAATLVSPARRDLAVGDETKYGQVIREMRASGSWFLPTLGGEPFTHKPPLHFWAVDLFTHAFGVYSMWAFVLPSLIALLFLLWIVWRMGGPVAAFVCGTSLMVWVSAQSARMDVAFTAFLTLAIWMLKRFLDERDARALLWCGVFLGIATLIKGPMAPVIALVLFALECWRRHGIPRANYVPAVAAMIVIPLLWVVPAMTLGGSAYAHEVIVKQTVGRAIASWVHRAPPWFYLLHMPAVLFPWFVPALAAIPRSNRFYGNWILAVLVPYSLMSSKLDVYMMAMIPAVALMIADAIDRRSLHLSNLATLLLTAIVGAAGWTLGPRYVGISEAVVIRQFCVMLAAAAVITLVLSIRKPLAAAIAVGLVPIIAFLDISIREMPRISELTSTRPLIAALEKQRVPPEEIALYSAPFLWSRDFPRELERVRYVDAQSIGNPTIIVTSRSHSDEIAAALRSYHRVDQVRMIGKWFDVYRR